ncbi:hypothetical protein M407DRAFT_17099 [Tulasnella calospora MUT 4182]|uniref:Uncharacterized protein n=1 Tax=Tulasnella calospora MUT 4182 TaxID=1051891 RepID=A0A0C3MKE1_9AGAM|nr:hypothetical protein M407DRAFT_17099 [Tulasnella calospora MUT 4182]
MSQAGPTSNRSRNVKKAANPNEFNQDKGKNHRRDSRPDNTSQQQSLESAGEGVDFKYREYGLDVVSNLRDNADVKASTGNEVVPNFKNRKRVDG